MEKCKKCGSDFKTIPAGVSKNTGKAYNAFQVCSKQGCDGRPAQEVVKDKIGEAMDRKESLNKTRTQQCKCNPNQTSSNLKTKLGKNSIGLIR